MNDMILMKQDFLIGLFVSSLVPGVSDEHPRFPLETGEIKGWLGQSISWCS